jgi:hypothetical protein
MVTAITGLTLSGCGGMTGGQGVESAENPGVYPPSSVAFGKTYAEWSVEWWKWLEAIPKDQSPVFDETGERAAVGQSGPVWFLCATTGNPPAAERACTIPSGKGIFFPIVDTFYAIPVDGTTEAELRHGAKVWMDQATVIEATYDGRPLQGLGNYRFQSDLFEYTEPPPDQALWPDYAGTHQAVADGFYVLLRPPPPGEHTVTWHGKCVWPTVYPQVGGFETGAIYHLTVE